jgi:hypothetical protein
MDGESSSPSVQKLAEPRKDADELGFNFESHYNLLSKTVRHVLEDILLDISIYKHIHDWDAKFVIPPLDRLAGLVRQYTRQDQLSLNTLLHRSTVDEVLTVAGINHARPAIEAADDIESFMFFTKVRGCFAGTIVNSYRPCS